MVKTETDEGTMNGHIGRKTGRVDFFHRIKGYGFILSSDNIKYFTSHRYINSRAPFKYLIQGQEVEFDVSYLSDSKYPVATNLTEVTSKRVENEVCHGSKRA